MPDPARVEHIACWVPPDDVGRYPNLRTILSVGANVDHMPPLPDAVALVRTLAPGIERMVREYAVMAALALHRDLPRYLERSARGAWDPAPATPAEARRVGVMGMGRIGARVAETLAEPGFPVAGWSRSGAPLGGVEVHGRDGLGAFLSRTDLLICLLPLTRETRGILGAETFEALPRGARLVHAGRGAHLDMEALRAALGSGRLASAMIDVTEPESLPGDHWAWRHPQVIVTPHVASYTDTAEGVARADILHVAQSQHHDIGVSRDLGLANAWIERRHDRPGYGGTIEPARFTEPDFRFRSMEALADAVVAAFDAPSSPAGRQTGRTIQQEGTRT